jgi:putative ABC transport system substrate-binding protein
MASRKSGSYGRKGKKTIGFLGATNPMVWSKFIATFEEALRGRGWVNGGNASIMYRWAEGERGNYKKFAKEFVNKDVDIIVTSGTMPALAVKKATLAVADAPSAIPVVVAALAAPVASGLVSSFAQPGGNITGMSNEQINLASDRLDAFRSVVAISRLGIVGNPNASNAKKEMDDVYGFANHLSITPVTCEVTEAEEITTKIKNLKGQVDALYVCTDAFLTAHQVAIHVAAASAGLPTMHAFREYVEAGGLMSYGPNFRTIFQHAAVLVDQILRGASPAKLPIKKLKKNELVISASTAQALGVAIPQGIKADIIE